MASSSYCRKVYNFFTHFQIEFFMFVFIFSLAVEDVTVTLIAQDKICMSRFNSSEMCSNLASIGQTAKDNQSEHDELLVLQRDQILRQVTTFNFYQSVIYTVPVIFSSMFLSSWADRHKSATKTLVCLTALMATIESIYVLLCAVYFHSQVEIMLAAFAFFPLVGGAQSLGMAAISYLSTTTKPTERVKRFSILELTYILSHPLGIFVGGLIIQNPVLSDWARRNGQLHNYHQVMAVAALGKFASFLYAALMRFKRRRVWIQTESDQCTDSKPLLCEVKAPPMPAALAQRTKLQKFVNNSTDLFVWRNIAESFEVVLRRRPNRVHRFIWLVLLIMTVAQAVARSNVVIMFQFVQKLYAWDAGTFSRYNSLLYLSTHLFGLLMLTPVLTKLFRLSDSTLLVVGLASAMSQNFIRGTIIDATAFCVSYVFGSISSLIAVACRTKLSRLAPADEQNRIFGVLTMLETIAPLAGITLYTTIFNQTISWYPGFVFQLSFGLLLVPFSLAIYIGLQPVVSTVFSAPTAVHNKVYTQFEQQVTSFNGNSSDAISTDSGQCSSAECSLVTHESSTEAKLSTTADHK